MGCKLSKKCSELKWNEVKCSELKWSEVKCSELKWSEVQWIEVKWSAVKGVKSRCTVKSICGWWSEVKWVEVQWSKVKVLLKSVCYTRGLTTLETRYSYFSCMHFVLICTVMVLYCFVVCVYEWVLLKCVCLWGLCNVWVFMVIRILYCDWGFSYPDWGFSVFFPQL